ARLRNATIVVADTFYPSSKTCSCCGSVKAKLDLSQRVYRCESCGYEADRDVNAARNLEKMAASFAVAACGEGRSGARRKPRVKRTSAKQEPDGRLAA
ncbi:MAG: zinc ribbon domain-containing protein, partial [Tagaea sp.]